jgi:hypothetical protein
VGSQLWQELSQVVGQRISKRNFVSILKEYTLSLETPEQVTTSSPVTPCDPSIAMNFPGGALSIDSPLYIERPPAETLACEAINYSSCLLRIKAPRQMGKTSLLFRVIRRAQELAYGRVFLDFKGADSVILASFDRLMYWTCCCIIDQLQLSIKVEDYWQPELGSKFSYRYFLKRGVFPQIKTPFLLIFDEVDQILESPEVVRDFFPLLRSCYEQSKCDRDWQKLRLVLSYSTEMYVPLQLSQSPFNVGLSVILPPFNVEQTLELAQAYHLRNWTITQAQEIFSLLNGHPYLLNIAFYYLYQGEINLTQLLKTADDLNSIFRHHLQGYLVILKNDRALSLAMETLLTAEGSVELDALTAYQLEGLGLITIDGKESRISCKLYRRYFQQQLLGKT